MKNYYEILGVEFNATKEDIKKSYREMAKKYHPDKHQQQDEDIKYYEERFKLINEAYEVLSNDNKRSLYDIELKGYQEREKRRNERRQQQNNSHHQQKSETNKTQHSYKKTDEENYRYQYNTEDINSDSYRYTTNREKSRRHSGSRVKDDSFFKSVKKSYQEVKKDESKAPFTKRHKDINKKLYKKYANKIDTDEQVQVFAFTMLKGVVHITYEALYQLSKLRFITKDNVIKYIIRNRRLAAFVLATIMISSLSSQSKTVEFADDVYIPAGQYQTIQDDNNQVLLKKVYVVNDGDSLSTLSNMSDTSIKDIKRANNLTSDAIFVGETLLIPYIIDKGNLENYTTTIHTNNMSIKEIAKLYSTDEDTLIRLNKDAIEVVNGKTYILTQEIVVPNFNKENINQNNLNKVKTYK